MNSKNIGQLSEAMALCEFQKYHIPVSIPWGDNERYDMIAEFDGKLNKIQVKTANEESGNGSIICYARSSYNHTTNKHHSLYENEIDYFVFVNQPRKLLALVPIEKLQGHQTITLRITEPKIKQNIKYNYFSDFSFDKKFKTDE